MSEFNSKLCIILDAIPDPVFVKDRAHKFVLVNNKFAIMVGRSKEEFIGKTDFDFFPEELCKIYQARDEQAFRTLQISEHKEDFVSSTGEQRVILTKKTVTFDENNKLIVVGVIRDITDRENEVKLLYEQQQKLHFAAKMSALGEMASNIAHEINNPLSVIVGRASRLSRIISGGSIDSEILQENLKKIEATGHRIAKIVRSLGNFSRDGEKDSFAFTKIQNIFDDTLELCAQRFNEYSIELKMGNLPDEEIYCRPVQISQVLLNLLNNSSDAVVQLNEKWIQLEVKSNENNFEISVTDSGHGIPQEVEAKMMKPFFTTKAIGKGTGLGLSVSRMIITEHGGELFLNRQSPHTQFIVRLPKTDKTQS